MDHVPLNRAWADDGNLNDQVVEDLRLQARQHVHLRAAFHLENAQAVTAREHGVGGRVRSGNFGEVADSQKREGLLDAGQHAKCQDVDLHDPKRIDIVLVPLDERAVRHGGVADRDGFIQATAGEHEAADMLGQVARETHQFPRQCQGALRERRGRIQTGLAHMLFRPKIVA